MSRSGEGDRIGDKVQLYETQVRTVLVHTQSTTSSVLPRIERTVHCISTNKARACACVVCAGQVGVGQCAACVRVQCVCVRVCVCGAGCVRAGARGGAKGGAKGGRGRVCKEQNCCREIEPYNIS